MLGTSPFIRISLACVFSLILLAGLSIRADDGRLGHLYLRFLANDGNSLGFVAFSRELVFPQQRRPATTNYGSYQTIGDSRFWYYAYCWEGQKYVIALSKRNVVSNVTELGSADSLEGFDGQFYWSLTLNYPTRSYREGKDHVFDTLVEAHNSLDLIPKDEPAWEKANSVRDPMVAALNERIAECRRVTQFGCSYLLAQSPRIKENTLILKAAELPTNVLNGEILVEITGSTSRPQTLSYSGGPPHGMPPAFIVSNDYARDTMTIDRLSVRGTQKAFEVRYGLLASEIPTAAALDSLFSWRTYVTNFGEVVAEIVTNGVTRGIDPSLLQAGQHPSKPKPVGKMPPKAFVVLFFGVTIVGAALLFRSTNKP